MNAHLLFDSIKEGCSALSLKLTGEQLESLEGYLVLLRKWNSAYNLTAVKNLAQMVPLHLLDSLSIAPYLQGETFIDVGTGPGLPGIPLAILFPEKHFTLLDSNGKKIRFIFQARQTLGLENVCEQHQRVEAFHPETCFDGVISRAFATLSEITEKCHHLVKPGGHFYAMKGKPPNEELSQLSKKYIVSAIHQLDVPGIDAQRHLVDLEFS